MRAPGAKSQATIARLQGLESKGDEEESEIRRLRRKILTYIFDCDFELSRHYEEDVSAWKIDSVCD